ncbi:MAG: hypothetical protein IJD16_02690 [Desulfovibrio sp.]|nr:hypothetical protein [Desulfovibrio sp.]
MCILSVAGMYPAEWASFDRARAAGFLVRRPRVSQAGSKGMKVKAREAARQGRLERMPASGTLRE